MLTYLPILMVAAMVTGMVIMPIFISKLLAPRNPYPEKGEAWECGVAPIGEADEGHFRVHFYIVAILFVIFDVETLFLFPWAVILSDPSISTLLFIEMVIFVVVLAVGLIYAWAKGALDWV